MIDHSGAEGALRERLARYPPARYPVQHATIRFHLGSLLLAGGDPAAAADELAIAVELFGPLPVERAKALLAWGVALRAAGRLQEAAGAFRDASAGFERTGMTMERAAATFNLGLLQAQAGESAQAADTLAGAAAEFERLGASRETAAAWREHGAALVAAGRFEQAIGVLEAALASAEASADDAGRGQAANALGLARLGAGHPRQAVAAFQQALAAHPRTIRPDGHAMAKANLAVAYEALGESERARLAAAQAACVASASPAVVAQAAGVLDRLGRRADDLLAVLALEPADRRVGVVRDEVARWLALDTNGRAASVAPFVAALSASPGEDPSGGGLDPEMLAEAWLAVLVELPPDALDAVVEAALQAPAGTDDRFRSVIRRAMLGFPSPQLLRLEATFAAVGERVGWT